MESGVKSELRKADQSISHYSITRQELLQLRNSRPKDAPTLQQHRSWLHDFDKCSSMVSPDFRISFFSHLFLSFIQQLLPNRTSGRKDKSRFPHVLCIPWFASLMGLLWTLYVFSGIVSEKKRCVYPQKYSFSFMGENIRGQYLFMQFSDTIWPWFLPLN